MANIISISGMERIEKEKSLDTFRGSTSTLKLSETGREFVEKRFWGGGGVFLGGGGGFVWGFWGGVLGGGGVLFGGGGGFLHMERGKISSLSEIGAGGRERHKRLFFNAANPTRSKKNGDGGRIRRAQLGVKEKEKRETKILSSRKKEKGSESPL